MGTRRFEREGLKKLFDRREFFLSRVFGSFEPMSKEQVRAASLHCNLTLEEYSLRNLKYSDTNQ